jgi:tetratricopeptide (TPR) repeat protein
MTGRTGRNTGSGSYGGLIVVILILAVAAGAGYAFRDQIKLIIARATKPQDTGLPNAKPVTPVVAEQKPAPLPKAETPPPPKPQTPQAPAITAAPQILALIAESEAALAQLEFDKAARSAQQAIAAQPPASARAKADDLLQRATIYGDLLSDVTINPEASGKLSILHGETLDIKAVIEREDAQNYYVILDNGIRAPVAKEDVIEVIPVKDSDKRTETEKELQTIKASNKDKGSLGLYLAAEFAYRNLLKDKVVPLLDEAFRSDKELRRSVHDHYARQLLYKALWHDSIGLSYHARVFLKELLDKYPDSTHVDTARKTLAEIDGRKTEIVVTMKVETAPPPAAKPVTKPAAATSGVKVSVRPPATTTTSTTAEPEVKIETQKVASTDPRVTVMVDEGNKYFDEAMKHYIAGRPGAPNSNEELRKAGDLFEKAEALYNKAVEIDPKNDKLQARASDAARLRYNCNKMQTLGS